MNVSRWGMSVNMKELRRLRREVFERFYHQKWIEKNRKIEYDDRKMHFDKETGKVIVEEKEKAEPRTLLNSQDYMKELNAMKEQMQLDDQSLMEEGKDIDYKDKAEWLQQVNAQMRRKYDLDLMSMRAFTSDMMKINVGLMV